MINKESNLVVHPGAGNMNNTLVNGLLHHCKGELSGIGGVLRPGIVHRIDKMTSGLLVVAKDDFTHNNLSKQFRDRKIKRHYVCITLKAYLNLKELSMEILKIKIRQKKNDGL